ncbi:MAG: hypothetical protein KF718_21970 [Polyangiaceae bacterium]|nr:hypothetical protein [Polyangiaceae bacterium]
MSVETLALLARAGVPIGPPRPAGGAFPANAELRAAVDEVLTCASSEQLVPHVAWLSALLHHWPARFRSIFGVEGEATVQELRRRVVDRNRYLKLRRIAVENLARVL